jgi:hypothetical protein
LELVARGVSKRFPPIAETILKLFAPGKKRESGRYERPDLKVVYG